MIFEKEGVRRAAFSRSEERFGLGWRRRSGMVFFDISFWGFVKPGLHVADSGEGFFHFPHFHEIPIYNLIVQ